MNKSKFIASIIGCLILGSCAIDPSVKELSQSATTIPAGKGRIAVYRGGIGGAYAS